GGRPARGGDRPYRRVTAGDEPVEWAYHQGARRAAGALQGDNLASAGRLVGDHVAHLQRPHHEVTPQGETGRIRGQVLEHFSQRANNVDGGAVAECTQRRTQRGALTA